MSQHPIQTGNKTHFKDPSVIIPLHAGQSLRVEYLTLIQLQSVNCSFGSFIYQRY